MSLKCKIIITILLIVIVNLLVLTYFQYKRVKDLTKLNEELVSEIESLEETNSIETELLGEHTLTFYTHTGNRTASGVYPKAGRTVAVDTRYIKHGTVLYIEGVGLRIAEDTGADIKGNRLDVFVDTKEEAIKKGVKKAKVHVVKEVK